MDHLTILLFVFGFALGSVVERFFSERRILKETNALARRLAQSLLDAEKERVPNPQKDNLPF